jgi:acyl carrier protein
MDAAGVTEDVIAYLAKERAMKPADIKMSHRLLDDLGMDGDDAVDFFLGLESRYGVDLSVLRPQWDRHFGPEGYPGWSTLPFLSFFVWVALLALHVNAIVATLVIPAGLTLTVLSYIRARRQRRNRPYVAVTVQDVVDAVSAGSWQMSYE